MKKLFIILIAALFAINTKAQRVERYSASVAANKANSLPEFKGGMTRFYAKLKRIPYTFWDRLNLRKGKVYLLMVVEKDGSLSDMKVIHGLSEIQNKEILRVAKKLDSWNPGMKNGEPVRMVCSVPINFELLDDVDPDNNFNRL